MIYVHMAEGFEEIETMTIVDVLRRAQIDVKTVSVTGQKMVRGTHGVNIEADQLLEETDYDACEMIVLPGGMPGAANLGDTAELTARIREFAKAGRKLAAICAAPMVLAANGALEGKQATIYPGMENFLGDVKSTGEAVTVDGNVITGKGPALAMQFALALVEDLKGKEVRDEVAAGLLFE